MSRSQRANIEFGVNIVIAVAIVVVATMVVKRHSFSPATPGSLPRISQGEHLSIPNVDWEQNEKTLVFFLMKGCKYCEARAPFYRELIDEASKRKVKWLAILPNSVEEGRQYVQSLQLPIENVQTGSLSSYKIPGTPSVLFVDNRGIVKSVWIGAAPGRDHEIREQFINLFDGKL